MPSKPILPADDFLSHVLRNCVDASRATGFPWPIPAGIKCKTGKFALARTTFLQVLEPDGITEAHEAGANFAGEQHSSRMPQKGDLSRAVPTNMNDFDAASDGQNLPCGQGLVDDDRSRTVSE
jgi:hypothetical protein